MSTVSSLLQIILAVEDKGLGKLDKATAAVKKLGQAEERLQKSYGNTRAQLAAISAARVRFSASIANEARRQLELAGLQTRENNILQVKADRIRAMNIKRAQLAAAEGNYTRALELVNRAERVGLRTIESKIQIQQVALRIEQQRQAQALRTAKALEQQAFAEVAVARAAGETSRVIALLNAMLARGNLSVAARTRAEVALAVAMRQHARETERQVTRYERLIAVLHRVQSVIRGVRNAFNTFTRVLAAFVLIGFSLRTFGRAIERFVVGPLIDITKRTLEATDQFARMDAALIGIVGSMRAVRSLTSDIKQASIGLPITALSAISGVRGLAYTPTTARVISNEGPDRVPQIQNILRVLTGLATIDPEQGIEGARFAVREALAGEFRSLRFRFELSPQVIASTIGKSLEDLKADPTLVIQALSKFVDTFIGDEAIERFNQLLSVQAERLRGGLQEFFSAVGGTGIYRRVTTITRNLANRFEAAGRGQGTAAASIGGSLDSGLQILLQTAERVFFRLTGKVIDLSDDLEHLDLDVVADAAAGLVEKLVQLTETVFATLPAFASLGEFLFRMVNLIPGVDPLPVTRQGVSTDIALTRNALIETQRNLESLRAAQRPSAEMARMNEIMALLHGPMKLTGEDDRRQLQEEQAALRERIVNSLQQSEAFQRGLKEDLATLGLLNGPFTPGGGIDPQKFLGASIADTEAEFQRLTERMKQLDERLGFFDRFNRVEEITAGSQIGDLTNEGTRAFGQFGAGLEQATDGFTKLSERGTTLSDTIGTLATRVTEGANTLDELTRKRIELEGKINVILSDLAPTVPEFYAGLQGITKLQNAEQIERAAFVAGFRDALAGVIDASEGFTRQLPDLFRIRQSADILGFASGLDIAGRPGIAEILQSQRSIDRGTNVPSALAGDLQGIADKLGIGPGEALDPRSADSYAAAIDNIGDSVARMTGDAKAGIPVVTDLADALIEVFEGRLADPSLSADIRENLNVAIEKMEDLKAKAMEVTDAIAQAFSQAAGAISSSFGDSLTEGIIAGFEDGLTGVREVLANLVGEVQRIVLRLIIEFMILRAFVNPMLNSTFGLTGANMLPTLGASGMQLSGGQVRPFAQGGFITGPQAFPMAGGQTGIVGEAGPEAVLPLGQDSSGRLGVVGLGGGGQNVVVNMRIVTPNPEAFRRSERQMMNRAKRAFGG